MIRIGRPLFLTALVSILLAMGWFYSHWSFERQKIALVDLALKIEKQQLLLELLQKDDQALRARLNDVIAVQEKTGAVVESEAREARDLLPAMRASIEQIKAVISQSRVEALMIKDDVKQWQKDYVSVLIELEERLNATDSRLKELQDRSSDSSLPRIQQEVDALKENIKTLNEQLSSFGAARMSAAAELFPPAPRFDPDLKK